MRNQYKILAEKYELILEGETEQPAQQGREIKGVFVPTEIENWINTMMKPPVYKKGGTRGEKDIIVGYKDVKADQDFEPAELNLIVKKIYNQWKDSSFEEIQQALKARGAIGRSLTQVRYNTKLTPAQRIALQLKSAESRRINNLKNIQDYTANSIRVSNNVLEVLAKTILMAAQWRSKVEKLPFFYNVNVNRPNFIIKKERDEAVEYIASIWPKDNICPATGLRLRKIPGVRTDNSPSLDKFIPEKGYVKGNVAVISDLANRIKNAGNLDQVYKVYKYSLEGKNVLKKIKNHANGFNEEIDNPVWIVIRDGKEVPVERIRVGNASQRAKDNNVPFNITAKYLRSIFPIKSAMVCPALGIPLIWSSGDVTDNTPALDRINPEEGYVQGNLVYISHLANTIKSNATPEQILGVYNWMKIHHAEPDPQIREELKQQEQQ